MVNSMNAMNTLLELAQMNLDKAAEVLAKANRDVAEAREQKTRLQTFREEYLSQRNLMSIDGLNIVDFKNYTNFIDNIDQAITGQDSVINQFLEIAKYHTQQWQVCQTKKRSYEVIIEKNHRQLQKLANKREQKLMDEFSSNQGRALMASSRESYR